jgi:hypothetical protein
VPGRLLQCRDRFLEIRPIVTDPLQQFLVQAMASAILQKFDHFLTFALTPYVIVVDVQVKTEVPQVSQTQALLE